MIMQDKQTVLNKLNALCDNTLMRHLSIVYTNIGDDFLIAEMPISSIHYQPMRILHGGASLSLAESVGSALSFVNRDSPTDIVKGLSMTANHVSSISEGCLIAKAVFEHKGRSTQVVSVEIHDQNNKLISLCRLTNIIVKK